MVTFRCVLNHQEQSFVSVLQFGSGLWTKTFSHSIQQVNILQQALLASSFGYSSHELHATTLVIKRSVEAWSQNLMFQPNQVDVV